MIAPLSSSRCLLRLGYSVAVALVLVAINMPALKAEPAKAEAAAKADPAPAATTKTMSTETTTTEKKYTVPSDEELKKKLTPTQYNVVRENGTERPFTNEYWQTTEEGIYVSVITGEPLFSSKDKFTSECGWPAFTKPISDKEVKELRDRTHGMERVEVRAKNGDSHLGHVFTDGPKEKGGLRYCINSAAIRFIPRAKMAEAGYGDLLKQLETPAKK